MLKTRTNRWGLGWNPRFALRFRHVCEHVASASWRVMVGDWVRDGRSRTGLALQTKFVDCVRVGSLQRHGAPAVENNALKGLGAARQRQLEKLIFWHE